MKGLKHFLEFSFLFPINFYFFQFVLNYRFFLILFFFFLVTGWKQFYFSGDFLKYDEKFNSAELQCLVIFFLSDKNVTIKRS